jgi:hypothetical protein
MATGFFLISPLPPYYYDLKQKESTQDPVGGSTPFRFSCQQAHTGQRALKVFF